MLDTATAKTTHVEAKTIVDARLQKQHMTHRRTVQTGPGPDGRTDRHKDAQLFHMDSPDRSGPEMAGRTVRKKIGHKKDKILLAQNYSRTAEKARTLSTEKARALYELRSHHCSNSESKRVTLCQKWWSCFQCPQTESFLASRVTLLHGAVSNALLCFLLCFLPRQWLSICAELRSHILHTAQYCGP